jgi:hypothetical protein
MPSFQIGKSIQQEVRNARMVGEFAVKLGVARIPGLLLSVVKKIQEHNGPPVIRVNPDTAPIAAQDDVPLNPVKETVFVHGSGAVEPIAGYDVLTTQQIVDAYTTLSANERAAVFVYEQSRRARSVIMQRYGTDSGREGV